MRIAPLLLGAAGLAASFGFASQAHAKGIEECGDLYFKGSGQVSCELEVDPGECKVHCEPLAFEAECAAKLEVSCSGGCNLNADVECKGSCEASCNASCTPGEFDCEGHCEAGCTADCDAQCSAAANKGECRASCEASCQAECSGSCTADPPECQAGCQASCEGQCKAEINMDCQVSCQSEGYVNCKAELQGGCEAQCESPDGALFCDGQWVQTTNVDECADAIIAAFQIEIEGYANAEGECSGNECSGSAEAGCSCSAPGGNSDTDFSLGFLALGMAVAGIAGARRVARRKSA
jgi:MYXO-CTERM domain-containing protein